MTSRLNAMHLAEANRVALDGLYQAVCQRLIDVGKKCELVTFEDRLANWTVSMNMRGDDVDSFLEKGHHRNIYLKLAEEIEDFVAMSGTANDLPTVFEAMEKDQPSWYSKRIAYKNGIDEEALIKYGAFCAEGNGTTYYGSFTILLKRAAVHAFERIFFLKTDSLFYVGEDLKFDEASFSEDIALTDNVIKLSVVKHENELEIGSEEAISCHCFAIDSIRRSYIEAQIIDTVETKHVGEIRWSKVHEEEMFDIGKRKLNGKIDFKNEKDALDILIYERHKRIFKKIRNLGLKFTVYMP